MPGLSLSLLRVLLLRKHGKCLLHRTTIGIEPLRSFDVLFPPIAASVLHPLHFLEQFVIFVEGVRGPVAG